MQRVPYSSLIIHVCLLCFTLLCFVLCCAVLGPLLMCTWAEWCVCGFSIQHFLFFLKKKQLKASLFPRIREQVVKLLNGYVKVPAITGRPPFHNSPRLKVGDGYFNLLLPLTHASLFFFSSLFFSFFISCRRDRWLHCWFAIWPQCRHCGSVWDCTTCPPTTTTTKGEQMIKPANQPSTP